jgi:hypothetical protein
MFVEDDKKTGIYEENLPAALHRRPVQLLFNCRCAGSLFLAGV